jgi:hypothetical protein
MRTNTELSALLQHYENIRQRELDSWRVEALEKDVIPGQERTISYNKRHGLPVVADENILRGMKKEYFKLTGKEYR